MSDQDNSQNIELRYISEKIAEVKTLYEKYEEKNCKKHDLILATINNSNGKFEEKFDGLRKEIKDCYVSKEEAKGALNFYDSIRSTGGKVLIFSMLIIFGLLVFIGTEMLNISFVN